MMNGTDLIRHDDIEEAVVIRTLRAKAERVTQLSDSQPSESLHVCDQRPWSNQFSIRGGFIDSVASQQADATIQHDGAGIITPI